ncbi:hypothetical protein SB751_20270 [Cupriavidus sp. SIMBA_020]|uniref:DUF6884 domain-containing protein n=1 Tax=Cupriavidus sp. SIMBA_020 TaxID=3085766 RepID=UPI00397DE033
MPLQLDLFPRNTAIAFDPSVAPLLLLACSGRKAECRAPALQLYQGVMYQTLRVHVRAEAKPEVVILSARHGFIAPDEALEPYDQRMSAARADELLAAMHRGITQVSWPRRAGGVFMVGGREYRRVMRAALRLVGASDLPIQEVCGGIGHHRAQLAHFLDRQRPAFQDQIGSHPNGRPLFRRYGSVSVGDRVVFTEAGPRPPKCAVLTELFVGPAGPTASADVEDIVAGRPKVVSRWISLAGVRPAALSGSERPAVASYDRIGDAVGLSGKANFSI